MKVVAPQTISNVTSWEDLRKYGSQAINAIISVVNGRITFRDNFQAQIINYNFTHQGNGESIDHTLGVAPTGYIITGTSVPMSISGLTSDENTITLTSSANGTANILVFV